MTEKTEKKVELTKEELQEVQSLIKSETRAVNQLGIIELQLSTLQTDKANLIQSINDLNKVKSKHMSEMVEKYGKGSLNIDTGEFTLTK